MRFSRLKFKFSLVALLTLLLVPTLVFAADVYEGLMAAVGIAGGTSIFGGIFGAPSIGDIIMNVIKFVLGVTGAITLLVIIIGGLRYVLSAGNEDQAKGAKKILLSALIGFVIIILAYTILTFIDKVILH